MAYREPATSPRLVGPNQIHLKLSSLVCRDRDVRHPTERRRDTIDGRLGSDRRRYVVARGLQPSKHSGLVREPYLRAMSSHADHIGNGQAFPPDDHVIVVIGAVAPLTALVIAHWGLLSQRPARSIRSHRSAPGPRVPAGRRAFARPAG